MLLASFFALVLTAGLAVGCGSGEDQSAGSSSGTDAGSSSGTDAGSSSGTDAGSSSGTDAESSSEQGSTSSGEDGDTSSSVAAGAERPVVAVTTSVLGDVVTQIIGSQAEVFTVMPPGADPHDFQPSAQEAGRLLEADALVVNGGFFEEGLLSLIEQTGAEGVPVFEALESVSTIEAAKGGHDDHDDAEEEHDDHDDHDEAEGDHDDHDHGDIDPHFFTDPNRMVEAVTALSAFLADEVPGVDAGQLQSDTEAYIAQLEEVDVEMSEILGAVPTESRVLVVNHDVFAYFADQYDFEVVGVVIPSLSSSDAVSAGELADLIETVEEEQVPAIFADSSGSGDLVDTVAAEVPGLQIVELYTESLGQPGSDGESYLSMLRTNASRISAALS